MSAGPPQSRQPRSGGFRGADGAADGAARAPSPGHGSGGAPESGDERRAAILSDQELELQELLDLARDKSAASRTRLVEVLGQLFFDGGEGLSDHERALMTEILRQLIHDVEKTVRQALAERMAAEPDAPIELVTTLANDEIEVAHPILARSEALRDLELIEIIQHHTMQHQLAIAMRKSLSESVSDALVETGDSDVITRLIGNCGAKLSAKTMKFLVDESESIEAYQSPLLHRPDLSPRLARQMYWWVSAALRKHIAKNFDIDSTELDSQIVGTVKDILGEDEEESSSIEGIDELVRKLSESHAITPQLLVQTLRQGQIALFEAMFAKMVGLRKQLVRRFIFESGGEGLAIACKAAEIYKADFASMFLLSRSARPGEKVVDPNELSRAIDFFDRIKPETAKKVVERWHLDPDYLYALKQVEADPAAPATTRARRNSG